MHHEAIKTLVPPEVYTDRQEFIDYFYNYALKGTTRRAMSTVLLGQRRMGKTEIFKRVVNRLFFEQDHTDPQAAVPVYYSFEDEVLDNWQFARRYVENFLRWQIAFRLRDSTLLTEGGLKSNDLADFVKAKMPAPFMTEKITGVLRVLESIEEKAVNLPQRVAVQLPREVSDWDDTTIVMFLDEFQNTHLPHHNFRIIGFMQEAVESPTCPHFVTGSAMSILSREIIGRGALFGRFDSDVIEPLSGYYGAELANKAAQYYQANLPTLMAPAVSERCGGNPFYITAVIRQAAKLNQPIANEKALNQALAIDISSGFIWGELSDQVNRWIERINQHGITKWILYLSALEEEERIDINRIQETLYHKEGKHVPLETIREVLVKLSRGDLVEYLELGNWFRKMKDPILVEFLKVWGKIEVEGVPYDQVQAELRGQYQSLKRRINEYKGHLAEVFMAQVLWAGQNKTVAGNYFNHPKDITIPWYFSFVRQRMRLGNGTGQEIDVLGAAGAEVWVCQSKWWETKKVDVDALALLLQQGEAAKADFNGSQAIAWIFAYSGLTPTAEKYATEHGVLWSTYSQFNALLTHLGLRELPQL